MKRSILNIILLIITSLSIFYAYVKASESDFAREEAENLREEVETLRDAAQRFQSMAEEAAAEAMQQQQLAEQALIDCQ